MPQKKYSLYSTNEVSFSSILRNHLRNERIIPFSKWYRKNGLSKCVTKIPVMRIRATAFVIKKRSFPAPQRAFETIRAAGKGRITPFFSDGAGFWQKRGAALGAFLHRLFLSYIQMPQPSRDVFAHRDAACPLFSPESLAGRAACAAKGAHLAARQGRQRQPGVLGRGSAPA